uniref:AB hydrolase-1 domain-containing protein n=1 Tax=Oryza rufipogon TaxID=4529 RepID=A0A0E0NH42_ORYRU
MASIVPVLLRLLLLLLPLPLIRDHLWPSHRRPTPQDDAGELHPIFLVPGASCSDLEARLTEAYRPSTAHCGAMKGKGWFGLWENNTELLVHDYADCSLEQMTLVYDPAANEYRNLPGVETRVPNFGSAWSFGYKNPVNRLQRAQCLGKLRDWLEELGYRDGDTMFGAPYDFRYAPPVPGQTSEVYSRYFSEFMALVEAATKKKQKKAVILGHSYGGMVALEFVRSTPRAWRDAHIERLVLVAPTLQDGFVGSVMKFITGTGIIFVPTATSTRPMWRSFESAMASFPSPAVFGREPLVVTKRRNYSACDMEDLLAALGFGEGVEPFRRRAVPRMYSLEAPMVPMTCINAVGNKTPLQLVLWDDDDDDLLDASPEVAAYGDGDGEINLISMLAFDTEMGRQPGQEKRFKSVKIANANHSTIAIYDFALKRIIQEIIEVNQLCVYRWVGW